MTFQSSGLGLLKCVIGLIVFFSLNVVNATEVLGKKWVLDSESSFLKFQSIKEKQGPKPEYSEFAFIEGDVDENGKLNLVVKMDSIDTKIDLRNVRMRFLLFETFKYPEAIVSADISSRIIEEIKSSARVITEQDFELNLHGFKNSLSAEVMVNSLSDNSISVSTTTPVIIDVADFDMLAGIDKLQDAAKVKILPSAAVHFDFRFKRVAENNTASSSTAVPAAVTVAAAVALENTGNFTQQECEGRFEILSRAGSIYFRSGSASLDPASFAVLSTLKDVVTRCPDMNIIVEGHTDSLGKPDINLALSVSRAESVANYLINTGVSSNRIRAIGFGESRPVASNDNALDRQKNRRIEFKIASS